MRAVLTYFISALFVTAIFGVGGALIYTILFVFLSTCVQEYGRMQSKSGREQIRREQQRERYIEEYWGTRKK